MLCCSASEWSSMDYSFCAGGAPRSCDPCPKAPPPHHTPTHPPSRPPTHPPTQSSAQSCYTAILVTHMGALLLARCHASAAREGLRASSKGHRPHRKINVTSKPPVGDISVVTLIRTDTTLDHSQKAEKVCPRTPRTISDQT